MSTSDRIKNWQSRKKLGAREMREKRLSGDAGEDATSASTPANSPSSGPISAGLAGESASERAERVRKAANADDAALLFSEDNEQADAAIGKAADTSRGAIPSTAKPLANRELSALLSEGIEINRGQPTPDSIDAAHRLAKSRRSELVNRRRWRFTKWLGIPLILFALYSLLFASTMYEARAVFTVTKASDEGGSGSAALGLAAPGSSMSAEYEMREYLRSRPVMRVMEEKHGFLSHLEKSDDIFTGPGGLLDLADPVDFYRRRVDVRINAQEGLATLTVQAGSREAASEYAAQLLALGKARLSSVADQLNRDQVGALEQEVESARQAVSLASTELGQVQQARGEVDPALTTTLIYQLIGDLELQLSALSAQRSSLHANGLSESPILPRLDSQIATLEQQISEQRARLVGTGGKTVQRSILLLEQSQTRKQLADVNLAATLQTLEQARLEALRQREYLVVVVPPNAPDRPNVWAYARAVSWAILLSALVALILFIAKRRRRKEDEL
tara:strand:+ start:4403 stop:5920 length:1518 start_codon:yes stop_codon:yes gene_type:complete